MTRTVPEEPNAPVLLHRDGQLGHIVLNRPRALNALNLAMVRRIDEALSVWEHDDSVRTVAISGAGGRGLCAGGDIRGIYEDVRDGDAGESRAFWAEEYRLNARIARCPKPYVALMDGIVMGGGVGVSAHGSVRVVTERSRVAMPETAIGFVPDVGGTYLLSRAPGGLGTYLALSATEAGPGDALQCGLADHFMPSDRLEEFVGALSGTDVADALRQYTTAPPEGELAQHRDWIDSCCSAGSVEEILERLRADGRTAAKEAAETIESRSPSALKATLAALRSAPRLGRLERVLDQEYRTSCAALTSHDFAEGVRARIIDKDHSPKWSPARLDEITRQDVDRYFAPLGDHELGLDAALEGPAAPR